MLVDVKPRDFHEIINDCWNEDKPKLENVSIKKVGFSLSEDLLQELYTEAFVKASQQEISTKEEFRKLVKQSWGLAVRNVYKKYKEAHPVDNNKVAERNKVLRLSRREGVSLEEAAKILEIKSSPSDLGLSEEGDLVASTDLTYFEFADQFDSLESLIANIASDSAGKVVFEHVVLMNNNNVQTDCKKRLFHWLKVEQIDKDYLAQCSRDFQIDSKTLNQLAEYWLYPQLYLEYIDNGVDVLAGKYTRKPKKSLRTKLRREYDPRIRKLADNIEY